MLVNAMSLKTIAKHVFVASLLVFTAWMIMPGDGMAANLPATSVTPTQIQEPSSAADYFKGSTDSTASTFIPENQDLVGTVRNAINLVMGFLGIIAVIIILFAGFEWMMSGGNEEQIKAARERIKAGALGLVIIFSAWMVADFVVQQLFTLLGQS